MKDLKMMMLPVIIMMAYMRAISRDTKMAIMMVYGYTPDERFYGHTPDDGFYGYLPMMILIISWEERHILLTKK